MDGALAVGRFHVFAYLVVVRFPGRRSDCGARLLCVTHAACHGVRPALATIMGRMTASMTLMCLFALGLGAVIAASDMLFPIIKWAEAAYLLYLGIITWRSQPLKPLRRLPPAPILLLRRPRRPVFPRGVSGGPCAAKT